MAADRNLLSALRMLIEMKQQYIDKRGWWSSHWYIQQWLASIEVGSRVLDVGAASGTLGRLCSGMDLIMDGVEPDPEWAGLALPYYREVWVSSLSDAPDEFLREHDVVVLADVLEHLVDPQRALQRLVGLQSEESIFIVSVPNVANVWMRFNLLLGKFNYQERGILDRTHLRFFTHRTFLELLSTAKLRVVKIAVTPIPLGLVNNFFETRAVGRLLYVYLNALTRLFPTFLGYQFVVMAVKSTSRD